MRGRRIERRRTLRFVAASRALAAAAVIMLSAPPAGSQSQIAVYKLAPDSPLASDGAVIFGVADDRRTLLVSSGGPTDWKVLPVRPAPKRISGLVWNRGDLYLSDDLGGAVYRLNMAEGSNALPAPNRGSHVVSAELLHQGSPLRQPRDLAFAGGLLVADSGAATVFQIDPVGRKPEVLLADLPPGEIHLAADRGAVVVTSPEAGEVRQPAPFERGPAQKGPSPLAFSVWRTRPAAETATPGTSSEARVPPRRSAAIQKPGAVALARGSLYLLDGANGSVYVTFRQQARPARVVPAAPVRRPTRLLALGDSLLILDGARGVLDRWPLAVPTEIDLGQDVPTALEALYRHLFEQRALATRRAPWRGSLAETLRHEGVWEREPTSALALVLCRLNPGFCEQGQWRTPDPGAAIRVPDVPIERVVDLATLDVEELGDRMLGDEVDRRIVSPEFASYREAKQLWELNASRLTAFGKGGFSSSKRGWGPYGQDEIRQLKQQDFPRGFSLTVPIEKARALVALPRALLREDAWLSEIRLVSAGFNWVALEEVEAKAYATSLQPQPSPAPAPAPCDLALLKQERDRLAQTIHYKLPPHLGPVNVGVVEELGIDVQHPAFGGPNQAFTYITAPPSPAPPVTDPPVCKASMPPEDHGTSVAGLIASRATPIGLGGFAPNVQIVPLRSTDEFAGDDLWAAFRNRNVRIFNLSVHYEKKLVTNVRQKINQLKEALFVVAAGNDPTDAKPVCESVRPYPAYPVCEGYRNNVLVVAATNPDGISLIEKTTNPPAPGSNWNDRLVHIAAPGTGYHAPARDNSYVPVRGTSFATPLVSATAALLYAEGVTDPWLIKQRIIATADQRDNLIAKVFGAGLLNVERAVTAPLHAVLGSATPPKLATLQSDEISIKWSGGSRTLPLANVRRLTKNTTGQSYRIIYLDDVTDTLVVQDEVDPGPWPFKYQNVDAAGNPTGGIVDDQIENYNDYVGPIR